MRRLMEKALCRYGVDATVRTQAGEQKLRVFFHSVNSRSWQNMERSFFPLGEIPRGQYICVLPAGAAVEAGDTIRIMTGVYQVRRVEDMITRRGPIYRWSLCVEKGGVDEWGAVG